MIFSSFRIWFLWVCKARCIQHHRPTLLVHLLNKTKFGKRAKLTDKKERTIFIRYLRNRTRESTSPVAFKFRPSPNHLPHPLPFAISSSFIWSVTMASTHKRILRSVAFVAIFFNYLQTFQGVLMIAYSFWMLNQWNNQVPSPPPPAGPASFDVLDSLTIPSPWYIYIYSPSLRACMNITTCLLFTNVPLQVHLFLHGVRGGSMLRRLHGLLRGEYKKTMQYMFRILPTLIYTYL